MTPNIVLDIGDIARFGTQEVEIVVKPDMYNGIDYKKVCESLIGKKLQFCLIHTMLKKAFFFNGYVRNCTDFIDNFNDKFCLYIDDLQNPSLEDAPEIFPPGRLVYEDGLNEL